MREIDPRKLEEALRNSGVAGSVAVTGVANLCAELNRSGILSKDAIARIRDAMVADAQRSAADFATGHRISQQVRLLFDRVIQTPPTEVAE